MEDAILKRKLNTTYWQQSGVDQLEILNKRRTKKQLYRWEEGFKMSIFQKINLGQLSVRQAGKIDISGLVIKNEKVTFYRNFGKKLRYT